MKERPILFSDALVRAILEGRKVETRRPLKLQAPADKIGELPKAVFQDGSGLGWIAWWGRGPFTAEETRRLYPGNEGFACPFGAPGDRLWVRESAFVTSWASFDAPGGRCRELGIRYEADGSTAYVPLPARIKPPIVGHRLANGTYREASRITLDITSIGVERVHDITEEGARAEGFEPQHIEGAAMPHRTSRAQFSAAWAGIYGAAAWDSNSWVWVVGFKVAEVKR